MTCSSCPNRFDIPNKLAASPEASTDLNLNFFSFAAAARPLGRGAWRLDSSSAFLCPNLN